MSAGIARAEIERETTMGTINEVVALRQSEFRRLSRSRRSVLVRRAIALCNDHPHCADASNYWRGLSARQVIAAD